jgi:hypothetical protein
MSTSSPEINALLATLGVSGSQRDHRGCEAVSGPRPRDLPMTEVSAVLNDGTSDTSSLLGRAQTVFVDARGEDSMSVGCSDAVTLFPGFSPSYSQAGQPKNIPFLCYQPISGL